MSGGMSAREGCGDLCTRGWAHVATIPTVARLHRVAGQVAAAEDVIQWAAIVVLVGMAEAISADGLYGIALLDLRGALFLLGQTGGKEQRNSRDEHSLHLCPSLLIFRETSPLCQFHLRQLILDHRVLPFLRNPPDPTRSSAACLRCPAIRFRACEALFGQRRARSRRSCRRPPGYRPPEAEHRPARGCELVARAPVARNIALDLGHQYGAL
jgi:hypothetical protein